MSAASPTAKLSYDAWISLDSTRAIHRGDTHAFAEHRLLLLKDGDKLASVATLVGQVLDDPVNRAGHSKPHLIFDRHCKIMQMLTLGKNVTAYSRTMWFDKYAGRTYIVMLCFITSASSTSGLYSKNTCSSFKRMSTCWHAAQCIASTIIVETTSYSNRDTRKSHNFFRYD